MADFRPGDKVRMKYFDGYATGEVTIVTKVSCKVMFDPEFDLDYWYYPKEDLELVSEGELWPRLKK